MSDFVTITLAPQLQELRVPRGTALQDVLFPHGAEFPCAGQGKCRGCKVKLLAGELPLPTDRPYPLPPVQTGAGLRLACLHQAESDLTLELAQWKMAVLVDDTPFAFTPRPGYGIAIDLGTTTLAAQLLDLQTARVLAVRTGRNPQASFGSDIMSRIAAAVDGQAAALRTAIRDELGSMVAALIAAGQLAPGDVSDICIVGNTPMHNLFCGISVEPLSHYPFHPTADHELQFTGAELGWLPGGARVRFLPGMGGFVGSDILAGLLATSLHERDQLSLLIDLGTNGEMVLGNRQRLLCASTAAGPAFEAARISCGMQATLGAINEVQVRDGQLVCKTIGGGTARGICGSGLVDIVAAMLELEWVTPNGRFAGGLKSRPLCDGLELQQQDIRELQLAKGAIAAGVKILLKQFDATLDDLHQVYLAGAFGNYIRLSAAQGIGLLPFPLEKVLPSGNTALLGAKLALFGDAAGADLDLLRERVEHVSLNEDPDFQDIYAEEMLFPGYDLD